MIKEIVRHANIRETQDDDQTRETDCGKVLKFCVTRDKERGKEKTDGKRKAEILLGQSGVTWLRIRKQSMRVQES